MTEFPITCVIERSLEDVFDALVNTQRIPDWNHGVIEVRTKDTPLHVGSHLTYIGKFLGRTFESESEVTEYVASSRFAARSMSGPFQLEVENSLQSTDTGTRLDSLFRGESRGFFKLAEPVIVRLSKKLFEDSTENFKALLEAKLL
jgi:uncharacterized protein YndB with AHSA1/START domain